MQPRLKQHLFQNDELVLLDLQVFPVIRCTNAGQPVDARSTGARRRSEFNIQCSYNTLQRALDMISHGLLWAAAAELSAADRRYELGRQPANTKLSSHVAVRRLRVRGGNHKFRALRLDHGNFSWGTEVRQQQQQQPATQLQHQVL